MKNISRPCGSWNMNETVLKIENLTKCYGELKALDNVCLTIKKGRIYGLVGQNGAGKTTLMRMITGLSYPTSGKVELFGFSDGKKIEGERKRIGSMIETPAFYAYMSAKENMEAVRIGQGIPNKKIVDDVLQKVRLNETGKKKVRDFSMGMKQRLGIAMTLVDNPEFLLLDEPTNGLDPVSIIEIRNMLQGLVNDKWMTIMISSHALEQLYHVATDYIFIHEGRILQTITKEELDVTCSKHIEIQVNDVEHAAIILEKELNTRKYKIMADSSIHLFDYEEDVQKVFGVLVNQNIAVKNITVRGDNLENYFVNLICNFGGNQND